MATPKLSLDLKEILGKTSTQTFLKAAREFIELVENKNHDKSLFYIKAHKCLVNLYSAGYGLENIELKYSGADTEFEEMKDEYFAAKNNDLSSALGLESFYWEVFDPTYEKEKQPTQGWLLDDFSDIYRDLKTELNKIYNIGTDQAVEDGLWQLRWGFFHHWGNHCINAMRAFHYLQYDGKAM